MKSLIYRPNYLTVEFCKGLYKQSMATPPPHTVAINNSAEKTESFGSSPAFGMVALAGEDSLLLRA